MKVFLAGGDGALPYTKIRMAVGCQNLLFSYHYMKASNQQYYDSFFSILKRETEVICDSGLFTLMFGAGKGGTYDMEFMRKYAKDYIAFAKLFPHKNLSIVEADVHKILGMPAVYELRKQFEDSGMRVMYVWHREEGIDGLLRMAEKYPYIAISVPELRLICKGKLKYQHAVWDLLKKIQRSVKQIPKIHLLGNTVQDTMETNLAYSCDSTSWLAGARFGRYTKWDGRKLLSTSIRGPEYEAAKQILGKSFHDHYEKFIESGDTQTAIGYKTAAYLSAFSYVQYQNWLDRNYKFAGNPLWT